MNATIVYDILHRESSSNRDHHSARAHLAQTRRDFPPRQPAPRRRRAVEGLVDDVSCPPPRVVYLGIDPTSEEHVVPQNLADGAVHEHVVQVARQPGIDRVRRTRAVFWSMRCTLNSIRVITAAGCNPRAYSSRYLRDARLGRQTGSTVERIANAPRRASFLASTPRTPHTKCRHVHESNVEPASPPDPGVHDGQRDRAPRPRSNTSCNDEFLPVVVIDAVPGQAEPARTRRRQDARPTT